MAIQVGTFGPSGEQVECVKCMAEKWRACTERRFGNTRLPFTKRVLERAAKDVGIQEGGWEYLRARAIRDRDDTGGKQGSWETTIEHSLMLTSVDGLRWVFKFFFDMRKYTVKLSDTVHVLGSSGARLTIKW